MDLRPTWFKNLFSDSSTSQDSSTPTSQLPKKGWLVDAINIQSKSDNCMLCRGTGEDPVRGGPCPECTEAPTRKEAAASPKGWHDANHSGVDNFSESCEYCIEEKNKNKVPVEAKVSLVAELEKQAGAYQLGETEEQTIRKSYETQVKTVSDFALAEMLTEKHLYGRGIQENWHLEFPTTLEQVRKNRKKAEKELMDHKTLHSMVDRMKFLSELMAEGFKWETGVDLFQPLFETNGKQSWEESKHAWKVEELTEQEKKDNQMPRGQGPGREQEDPTAQQSPRSTLPKKASTDSDNCLICGEPIMKGQDPKDPDPRHRDCQRQYETSVKDASVGTQADIPVGEPTEHIVSRTVEYSFTAPTSSKQEATSLEKFLKDTENQARWSRSLHVHPSYVFTTVDNSVHIYIKAPAELPAERVQVALKDMLSQSGLAQSSSKSAGLHDRDEIQELAQDKFSVTYQKMPKGEKYTKWFSTEESAQIFKEQMDSSKQGVSVKFKDYSKEFTRQAAIRKEADIPSPWKLVKQEDGSPVIARIAPEELVKESEELAKNEKAAKVAVQASVGKVSFELLEKQVSIIARTLSAKLVLISAKELVSDSNKNMEPAPNLEGLAPDEQIMWKKFYNNARSIAFSNPISRKIGEAPTRRAAMMALLRSIRNYDPKASTAKFETYLFRAVENEMINTLKEFQTSKEKHPDKVVDIDQPVSEGDNLYETDTLRDIIEDVTSKLPEDELVPTDREEQIAIAKEVVTRVKDKLKGTDLEVFDLLSQGYGVSDIAKMKNYSIPNIVRYRKKIEQAVKVVMEQILKNPPKVEPGYAETVDIETPAPEASPAAPEATPPAETAPTEETL